MIIRVIEKDFSVCQVDDIAKIDLRDEYLFLSKTDEEISIVCETSKMPNNTIQCEIGWKAFKIQGVLDFSLVGILAKISSLLAQNSIPLFAVSTFNTDYILVKQDNFQKSLDVLSNNGYEIL